MYMRIYENRYALSNPSGVVHVMLVMMGMEVWMIYSCTKTLDYTKERAKFCAILCELLNRKNRS